MKPWRRACLHDAGHAVKLWPPSYVYRRIQWVRHRTGVLRPAMPLWDSFKIAVREGKKETADVFIAASNRKVTVRLDTSDVKCLEQVFLEGEYGIPFVEQPKVIVDAGANIGMSTLYFASRFPAARIIAIEPEVSNFEMLRKNCQGLPNVTLLRAALWPRAEPLAVQDSSVDKWAFVVKKADGAASDAGGVSAITIPDILERFQISEIDLLKLDIEGAELDLFASCAEEWIDRIGTIAIELHDWIRPGCARAFYAALREREFVQQLRGENIIVDLRRSVARDTVV